MRVLEITCLYKKNLKRRKMFKLKDEYNTPDYVFADLNNLSDEEKQEIKDNYMNAISKYFDLI